MNDDDGDGERKNKQKDERVKKITMIDWVGDPLEKFGPRWAELGLEPQITTNWRFSAGDVVQVKGSNQRMVIVREASIDERIEHRKMMGVAAGNLPRCYIVVAD